MEELYNCHFYTSERKKNYELDHDGADNCYPSGHDYLWRLLHEAN